ERRIERDVVRRELLLLLDLGLRFLAALVVGLVTEREVRARAAATEHQQRDDADDQALLALRFRRALFTFDDFDGYFFRCHARFLERSIDRGREELCNGRATPRV